MARLTSRTLLFSAFLLLSASSLSADDVAEQWRVSILASEISESEGEVWSDGDPHAGLGVGIAYSPKPNWDVELTVASKTHRSPYTRFFVMTSPNGNFGYVVPVTEFREFRVQPVDLSVTRHFLAHQTVAPYVRAGVRYVDAPRDPGPTSTITTALGSLTTPLLVPVSEGFGFDDRTSAQAGAGVRIRLTPRTALRTEVTRLLRSDGATFDPLTRFAAGVSWAF